VLTRPSTIIGFLLPRFARSKSEQLTASRLQVWVTLPPPFLTPAAVAPYAFRVGGAGVALCDCQ
jgi:hypothetical protein